MSGTYLVLITFDTAWHMVNAIEEQNVLRNDGDLLKFLGFQNVFRRFVEI